jgi:hypothetical protein
MRPIPRRASLRRPAASRRPPQSRCEAAVEYIRLEYERKRLSQALAALDHRRVMARERLTQIETRARTLHGMLDVPLSDADQEPEPALGMRRLGNPNNDGPRS